MHRKDMIQMVGVILVIVVLFFLAQKYLFPSPAPSKMPANAADNTPSNAPANAPATNKPDEDPPEISDRTPADEVETRPTTADPKRGFVRIDRESASTTTLANSRLTAEISERGAIIDRLTYVDDDGNPVYLKTPDNPVDEPEKPLELIQPLKDAPNMGTLGLALDANDAWRNTSRWERVGDVTIKDGAQSVTYRFPPSSGFEFDTESDGTVIFKTITLLPDTYRFDVNIRIENRGAKATEKVVGLWGPVGITNDASRSVAEYSRVALYGSTDSKRFVDFEDSPTLAAIKGEIEDLNEDLEEEGKETQDWVAARYMDDVEDGDRFLVVHGLRTQYFLAFLGADPDNRDSRWSGKVLAIQNTSNQAATSLIAPPLDLPAMSGDKPGEAGVHMRFYAGPRDKDVLNEAWAAVPQEDDEVKKQWAELATSGFWDVIAAPMIWILGGLTQYVGAGWAIILLTLLVRFSLAPLSYRGQKSMATYTQKMKVVKPKLDAIKEKYKGKSDRDAQLKMLTETRQTMKEHNVGMLPLGGCMPMLIQLPIFIGLYRAFGNAFFLRQAEFLWIHDLSLPDATLPFSTYVGEGWIGFLAHNGYLTFNVLPMLWIVLSIVQFKLQPKSEDPQQQAIQKQMAFIFPLMGLFFYGFAAGFSLYFIFSSLYSIGESKLIKYNLRKQGIIPHPKDTPKVSDDEKPEYHGAS